MIELQSGQMLDLSGAGAHALQGMIDSEENPAIALEIHKLCMSINTIVGNQISLTSTFWLSRFGHSLGQMLDAAGLKLTAPRQPVSACFDRQYLHQNRRGL